MELQLTVPAAALVEDTIESRVPASGLGFSPLWCVPRGRHCLAVLSPRAGDGRVKLPIRRSRSVAILSVTHLTRLETRTRESGCRASRGARQNPQAQ